MSIIQHFFFDLLGSLATIALWGITGNQSHVRSQFSKERAVLVGPIYVSIFR